MRLSEIVAILGGEINGDPGIEIKGVSGIHEAEEGEITFLSDRRLAGECIKSRASAVIVREFITGITKPQIVVKSPYYAFAKLLEIFHARPLASTGISRLAVVSEDAVIGSNVTIGAFAYISEKANIGEKTVIYPGVFIGAGTTIGSDCIIYPNVTIREEVTIGSRVIIHPGAVIGSDGFGYVFEGGRHYKIPQVGSVLVGDDVEIGANVTIDRATTGRTAIGNGTKIDNLVQIGHNVRIGADSIVVAQVGIGGSSEIGALVSIGGQVGIADHAKIDDGCMIAAQAGVTGHLSKGVYSGSPAISHREHLKAITVLPRLPELSRRIKELEEKLSLMERRQPDGH